MKLYSTKEAAEILGVSTNTIRAMIDRGEIRTYGYQRPKSPKRHRRLQIAEGTIISYIKSCPSRFPSETLARFNICDDDSSADTTQKVATETASKKMSEAEQPIETPYILSVNGRIAIGNVTKETAVQMFLTLLNDPLCCIESIKIEVMKRGKGGEHQFE